MRIINTKACLVNRSSQRSMQKKKRKKLKSQGKYCWLCTWAGRTWSPLLPSGKLQAGQEQEGGWLAFSALARGQRAETRSLHYAEAVGVFPLGVYIQTHPGLMYFYTCMYTHTQACYSFLETTSSTSGSWMPTLVPLSLLEEEDSRDFLEAKDTPLPCNLPVSSSLPVTS